jgi:GT2 family glycosyltransferase
MADLTLSVIIVNWNTREFLRACLLSLTANALHDHSEIIVVDMIVVDNASTDGSAAMVAEDFPTVTLIASDRNLGFAAGNNAGFEVAKGEYWLVLNPDTEILPGSLESAVEILKTRPEIAAVGACQIGVDGEIQRSVRGFPTVTNLLRSMLPGPLCSDEYWQRKFDYSKAQSAPQPMATFTLFRAETVRSLAGYDEQFPIFFNDVDLCKRIWDSGSEIWYSPDVKILHHGGEGTRQVRKAMIWESSRSLIRYLKKHHGHELGTILLLPGLTLMVYALAFIRAKGFSVGFRP